MERGIGDSPANTCNGECDWCKSAKRQQLSKTASVDETIDDDDRRRRLPLRHFIVLEGDNDLSSGIVELCMVV